MRRRHVSRRQTPATGTPLRIPDTFRTLAADGEPVHTVDWATDRLHAPCGAWTFRAYREEQDPRCPEEVTCPACLAWLAAPPKPDATDGEG